MSLFAHVDEPRGVRFVSERDLIQALSLSRTTLWRLRKEGLPSFTTGRTIRYDLEKVRAWLESNEAITQRAAVELETGQDDGLAECHWSLAVALDPKHRPQEPGKPASTARREWWRFPQEAHLLDRDDGRYRRLAASEVATIQGFPSDWGTRAIRDELLLMRGYGDAVPPAMSAAVFAELPELLGFKPKAGVEVCAGFGGMALGEKKALGVDHLALFERWDVACEVLRNSGVFEPDSVREQDLRDVDWSEFAGRVDILTGGPPCQPWSQGGKGLGSDDDRDLLGQMPEIIEAVAPNAFVFENVPGLLAGENEPYSRDLVNRLRNAGGSSNFGVALAVFNAADFGLPQRRRRVFIVGARGRSTAEIHSFFDRVFARRTHAEPRLAAAQVLAPWRTVGSAIPDWREAKSPWRRWPVFVEGTSETVNGDKKSESRSTSVVPVRIGLTWPSRGRAVSWNGDAWIVSEEEDNPAQGRTVPLLPFDEYRGDPSQDPWIVTGEPMVALDALRRSVGRQAQLVYIDMPRIRTNAGAFDAADRERVLDTWLSVCRATLRRGIALLDDRGAISVLCGIDETVFVRQILDELLGSMNHVGTVAWQKGYSPRNMPNMRELSPIHDNIVIFARRKDALPPVRLRLPSKGFKNPDNDPRGFWKAEQKGANKADCDYSINIPPYRWRVIEGQLPPGLWRLSPKSGIIWGKPTEIGLWNFVVEVSDRAGRVATRRFSIEITANAGETAKAYLPWLIVDGTGKQVKAGGEMKILTASLPIGSIGTEYSASLLATGGTPWQGTTRPGKTSSGGKSRYWEFPASTLLSRAASDSVDFKSKDDAIPALKVYEKGAERTLNQTTLWFGRGRTDKDPMEVDYSQDAKQELEALLTQGSIKKSVPASKPAKLMTRLLALFTEGAGTVVDIGSPAAEMAAVATAAGRRSVYVPLPGDEQALAALWLPRLQLASSGRHPLPEGISFAGEGVAEENTFILDGSRQRERDNGQVQLLCTGAPFAEVDAQLGAASIRYDEYPAGSRRFLAALASVEGMTFLPEGFGDVFAMSRDRRIVAVYLDDEHWLDRAQLDAIRDRHSKHLAQGGRVRVYYHRGQTNPDRLADHRIETRRVPFALVLSAGIA